MNKAEWNLVKESFNKAMSLSAEERESFVDEVFLDQESLKTELVQMLAAETDEGNHILDSNAFGVSYIGDESELPVVSADYDLVREIGVGGMGRVYEGVRRSGSAEQKVAVKIIKRGMDSDQILRRFEREQKILAKLNHPYIASFIEGGVTSTGQAFYAMEFVEGKNLTSFCSHEKLSLNTKLVLFIKICEAVHFAHRNLVIHRDLKPGNIIVGSDQSPKLLDFGIGKFLADDEDDLATATGLGLMTPSYASPEQILGEQIGTSSDIYSLGVILYELLAGKKPIHFDSHSPVEIHRKMTDSEPSKPSTAGQTEDAQYSRRLRGDLDNIVLKAIRRSPEERYLSANDFARDIQRYLDGEPVNARAATYRYRFQKFVSRNKVPVLASALVFLSLVGGIVGFAWQGREAMIARQRAEKRFDQVRELAKKVVFEYHDEIEKLDGSTAVREKLVKDATVYLDNLAEDSEDDPALRKELGFAYAKLADVQGKMYDANTGNSTGALEAYRKAIRLLESVPKENPERAEIADKLFDLYGDQSLLMVRTGKSEETQELMTKSKSIVEELRSLKPDSVAVALKELNFLIRFGDVAKSHTKRIERHKLALKTVKTLEKSGVRSAPVIEALARINQRLGSDHYFLWHEQYRKDENKDLSQTENQIYEFHSKSYSYASRLLKEFPETKNAELYKMITLGNVIIGNAITGRDREALELAPELRKMTSKLVGKDKHNRESQHFVSVMHSTLGEMHEYAGRDEKAVDEYKRAIKVSKAIFEKDSGNGEAVSRVWDFYSRIARIHRKNGEGKLALEAEKEEKRYFKLRNKVLGN